MKKDKKGALPGFTMPLSQVMHGRFDDLRGFRKALIHAIGDIKVGLYYE